jgi:hypothetical protein
MQPAKSAIRMTPLQTIRINSAQVPHIYWDTIRINAQQILHINWDDRKTTVQTDPLEMIRLDNGKVFVVDWGFEYMQQASAF